VNYHTPDVTAPPRMLFIASPSANGFAPSDVETPDGLVAFCPGNYHQEKEIYNEGPAAVAAFNGSSPRISPKIDLTI